MANKGNIDDPLFLLSKLTERELSEQEWQDLDRLAADDPFIRDGLQGLRATPAEMRQRHLESIEQRIKLLLQKRRRKVLLIRISSVASVLLLVAVSWIAWQQFGGQDTNLAEQIQTEKSATRMEPRETPETEAFDVASDQAIPQSSPVEIKPRVSASPATSAPATEELRTEPDESLSFKEDRTSDAGQTQELSRSAAKSPPQESAYPQPSNLSEHRTTKDLASTTIYGTVEDESGAPLIGASVIVPSSSIETTTDIDGQYSFDLPVANITDTMVVTYTGYSEAIVPIVEEENDITLSEGVLLDEVTISKAKRKLKRKKNSGPLSPSYAMAVPVDGWDKYYRYVRKNLSIPESASKAEIEGAVYLEFDLDPQGVPTDIRVTESLGYGCDEEAIRILRNGPKWNVRDAQVPIGRLSIEF